MIYRNIFISNLSAIINGYLSNNNENEFKITVNDKGILKISLDSFAESTYIDVYNIDGKDIEEINKSAVSGKWLYSWNGYRYLEWNPAHGKANGSQEYNISKGTYYIRLWSNSHGKKCTVSTYFTSTDAKAATGAILTVKIKKGETLQLGTILSSSDSTGKTTWKTNKSSVATVSTSGKVTAKAKGSATITAAVNGIVLKIRVKVTESYNIN